MKIILSLEILPVLRSASKLIHKVFGKILLEGWEASIQEFQKAYVDMQQRIAQDITKSDRKELILELKSLRTPGIGYIVENKDNLIFQ